MQGAETYDTIDPNRKLLMTTDGRPEDMIKTPKFARVKPNYDLTGQNRDSYKDGILSSLDPEGGSKGSEKDG